MATDESIPSETQSTPSVQSNHRGKTDIGWDHVQLIKHADNKITFICNYCKHQFHGGGINRMKQHLACQKGNVVVCPNVPGDVKSLMETNLFEAREKTKEKYSESSSEFKVYSLDEDEVPKASANVKKRKAGANVKSYFKRGIQDSSQPSIKSVMQSKEKIHDTDLAMALWFYDACIPMNAVNSPLFPIAMSKVATMGHGYTGPSYHSMRVPLLKDAKTQVSLIVENYRKQWADTGCTIMSDGWRDVRQRPLINFLVYCSKGVSFIKSVDASDFESNAQNLCNLFGEIVEIVGPKNVVHFVTDNAANYKAAGTLLCARYPSICWSPCAAHCINLILKDVADLPHVDNCIKLASRVTVFIYNHKWPLNWLRNREGWSEIIRPGATRFGTAFIALKSLYEHRSDLEALVISGDYQKKMFKLSKGKDVKQICLNQDFWKNCLIIVNVMSPLLKLLRICDSDEKPSLGYVFEGMSRTKQGIEKLFRNKRRLYEPYTNIIDKRWDNMLRKSLHAAAYWLNPVFQYDEFNFKNDPEVMTGVIDMVQKSSDKLQLTMQLNKFAEAEDSFGQEMAVATRKTMRPDTWWKIFGGSAPNLQKFAIRILCQTASSSGCERNWSVFERIHTKKRNRLEHQRLNDLVYVHYNLRLQNRLKNDKRSYDPVDYECIDKTEYWVVDEEAEGELDFDELESMLDEVEPTNCVASTSQTQGDESQYVDVLSDEDDEFRLLDDDDLDTCREFDT